MEHESDDNTNCNWCFSYRHQRIDTRTGELGNKGVSGEHPNYYITEIGQNTEKSPANFRDTGVKNSLGDIMVHYGNRNAYNLEI